MLKNSDKKNVESNCGHSINIIIPENINQENQNYDVWMEDYGIWKVEQTNDNFTEPFLECLKTIVFAEFNTLSVIEISRKDKRNWCQEYTVEILVFDKESPYINFEIGNLGNSEITHRQLFRTLIHVATTSKEPS